MVLGEGGPVGIIGPEEIFDYAGGRYGPEEKVENLAGGFTG